MDYQASFFDNIFSYPLREQLLLDCPALTLLSYRHLSSALISGNTIIDPLAQDDALSLWFRAKTISQLCDHIWAPQHVPVSVTTNTLPEKEENLQKEKETIENLTTTRQTLNQTLQMALQAVCLLESELYANTVAATPLNRLSNNYNNNTIKSSYTKLQHYLYTIRRVDHFIYSHTSNDNNNGHNEVNNSESKIGMNETRHEERETPSYNTPANSVSSNPFTNSTNTAAANVDSNIQLIALSSVTLRNTLEMSTQYLRKVTSCALSGTLEALSERRHAALRAIMQFARLVPPITLQSNTAEHSTHSPYHAEHTTECNITENNPNLVTTTVTSEGLNFCMLPLQQQWWVLLNGAMDRVLALLEQHERQQSRQHQQGNEQQGQSNELTLSANRNESSINTNVYYNNNNNVNKAHERVTKPLLWQMLAILALLDTTRYMYIFPSKEQDLLAHHLLARLAEIGLVYPVKSNELKCFALSPHYYHALEWQASAPLCHTAMVHVDREMHRTGDISNNNNKNTKNNESKDRSVDTSRVEAISAQLRREDIDTIITETNFRLYAYTQNQDLLRILDQFAIREEEIETVLVCYRVTRNSFASAVRKGITAAQVLKFLSLRAHPSMHRQYHHASLPMSGSENTSGNEHNNNNSTTNMHERDSSYTHQKTLYEHTPTNYANTGAHGGLTHNTIDQSKDFVVPRSFCDQLMMWEVECNRVTFTRNLVLLRNVTTEQQTLLRKFFSDRGEVDAIFYSEPGYLVVRQEVYDRLLAPLMEQANDNNINEENNSNRNAGNDDNHSNRTNNDQQTTIGAATQLPEESANTNL